MDRHELKEYIAKNPEFKFDKVTLRNLGGTQNFISCDYELEYTIDSKTDVMLIPVRVKYPFSTHLNDAGRKLVIMALNIQLVNMRLFSKKTEFMGQVGFLDKRDELFLHDLHFQTSSTFAQKFPEFKDFLSVEVQYPELDPTLYHIGKNDKLAVSMSGGKESGFSYSMLKKLNYGVTPLFVDEGRFMPSEMTYEALPWSPVIETNIFDMFDFVAPKWGKNNLFLPIICFLELAYCNSAGIRNLVFGNEYDCTVAVKFQGHTIYGHNFDQSTVFERKVTQYLKDIGLTMQVFSLVYNLSSSAIQRMFADSDAFNLYQYQMSCFTPKKTTEISDDGVAIWKPCNECDKCQRIGFQHIGMGISPDKIGLSDHAELANHKDANIIFNCEDGWEEFETLLYGLEQQGKLKASSRLPKLHDGILGISVDDLHPMILPRDIKNFYKKNLEVIRKDLKVE